METIEEVWLPSTLAEDRTARRSRVPDRDRSPVSPIEHPDSSSVPSTIRVTRDGREINRVLSRTNFAKALPSMPASNPSLLKGRQGSAYVWAILMDPRIRQSDW